jgi:hypothetical protein
MKRRNPNDATWRNVRAANKKLVHLTARVKAIEKALKDVWFIGALVNRVDVRVQTLEHKLKGKTK